MTLLGVALLVGSALIVAGMITTIVQRLVFGKRVRRGRSSWWLNSWWIAGVLLTGAVLAMGAISASKFGFDIEGMPVIIALVLIALAMIWGVAITVRVVARFIEGRPGKAQ